MLEVFVQVSSSVKSRGLKVSSLPINPLVLTNTLKLFLHSINDRGGWAHRNPYSGFIIRHPEKKTCAFPRKDSSYCSHTALNSPRTEFS